MPFYTLCIFRKSGEAYCKTKQITSQGLAPESYVGPLNRRAKSDSNSNASLFWDVLVLLGEFQEQKDSSIDRSQVARATESEEKKKYAQISWRVLIDLPRFRLQTAHELYSKRKLAKYIMA